MTKAIAHPKHAALAPVERRRGPTPLKTVAGLALAGGLLLMLVGAGTAAAAKRPMLTAPSDAEQGRAISLSVEPRGAKRCRLGTRAPSGRLRTRRIPGGRGYALDARVRGTASVGRWSIKVRCARRWSATRRLFISGFGTGESIKLLKRVKVFRFRKTPVKRLSRRKQNSRRGPKIEAVALDGLGAGEGGRAEGSIGWALARQGDTSYNFWCLKFVAHAYGAGSSGYSTAQIAANALGVRGRAAGPAAAPRGALVFFRYKYQGVPYGHVGISLGDGRMVHAVRTVRVASMKGWAGSYLGWAYPPSRWPGRFVTPALPQKPSSPPSTGPAPIKPSPSPPSNPPAPTRKPITVYNKLTNGPTQMREDPTPVRLTTKPWKYCTSRGCNINGTERSTDQRYDAAVCHTTGDETTNGDNTNPNDDSNTNRYTSNRYYGVKLTNGTFGYVSWVWIRAADRGGLGLPAC